MTLTLLGLAGFSILGWHRLVVAKSATYLRALTIASSIALAYEYRQATSEEVLGAGILLFLAAAIMIGVVEYRDRQAYRQDEHERLMSPVLANCSRMLAESAADRLANPQQYNPISERQRRRLVKELAVQKADAAKYGALAPYAEADYAPALPQRCATVRGGLFNVIGNAMRRDNDYTDYGR